MKNIFRMILCGLVGAAVTSMCAAAIQAQASRTWVSGVGDDVNPCSRTAPCKTFAGAIGRTMMGGEISVLDPGGFGTVVISKSISIDGTGSLAGIAANTATGITINITDPKDTLKSVRLRGLTIDGFGAGVNGINVIAANSVTVEDTIIDGFAITGILIRAGYVFVKNSTIRNNEKAFNVAGGELGLTDTDVVFNVTAFTGTFSSITWLNDVVLYGNKKGDSKPPGVSSFDKKLVNDENWIAFGHNRMFVTDWRSLPENINCGHAS